MHRHFLGHFFAPSIKPPKRENQKWQKKKSPLGKGHFDPPGGTPPWRRFFCFGAYRFQQHLGYKKAKTPFCVDLTGFFANFSPKISDFAVQQCCTTCTSFANCLTQFAKQKIVLLVITWREQFSVSHLESSKFLDCQKFRDSTFFCTPRKIIFFPKIKFCSSRKKQSHSKKNIFLPTLRRQKIFFLLVALGGRRKKKFCAVIFFSNFLSHKKFAVARDFFFWEKKSFGGKILSWSEKFWQRIFFFFAKKKFERKRRIFFFEKK